MPASSQECISTWIQHWRGRYAPVVAFDWNAAVNEGLSSTLFDIEANIRDGDPRVGLDEVGMQDIRRIMQENGLSFDEARLRRHRILLQKHRIDPQTGIPMDSKAVTRL